MQAAVDRILRQTDRMKNGIERVSDQLVERLELDLQDYLNVALVALETPTTNHPGRFG